MINYLREAARLSWCSTDPRTKIGAVIYDAEKSIANGFNDLSAGYEGVYTGKDKYKLTLHAEQAAIFDYFRYYKKDDRRIGMAATAACCTECAKAIVAAGISEVLTCKRALEAMPAWEEEFEIGHQILAAGGVKLILVPEIGEEVFMSGELITI